MIKAVIGDEAHGPALDAVEPVIRVLTARGQKADLVQRRRTSARTGKPVAASGQMMM